MKTVSNSNKTPGVKSFGASPMIAATYAAGIVYMWGIAVARLLATNSSLGSWFFLYPLRTGDVAAIWLSGVVPGILVFFIVFGLFRGRTRVGSLYIWTAVLVISTILAPLIGEIGTPIGI